MADLGRSIFPQGFSRMGWRNARDAASRPEGVIFPVTRMSSGAAATTSAGEEALRTAEV